MYKYKIPAMKRLILTMPVLLISLILNAQSDAVDALFNKYSDKDGFTTVTISSKLLGLFADKDKEKDKNDVINRLTSIKILSVEDPSLNKSINFYVELKKKLDLSGYEELMDVKEGSDVTKFLIKQKGERISELIVISGGPAGNSLISIRGDLDLKSLSELSEDTGIDELKDLENIEGKKP
jgi:hypothetical protein